MERKKFTQLLLIATLIIISGSMAHAQLIPKQFIAYSSSGVLDLGGQEYLKGNPSKGDLLQIIWVGPNGMKDPADSLGHTTVDDSLLGTSYIGYGIPSESDWDTGKFSASFSHDLLFVPGTQVFVRAWNDSVINGQNVVYYGDSDLYEIQNTGTEAADFGTWTVTELGALSVEMTSFSITARPGRIILSWTTQSETQNLGFHVFKSLTEKGEKKQVTTKLIPGAGNSESKHSYQWEDPDVKENITYFYWVADVSENGMMQFHGPKKVETMAAPKFYSLDQNYPNPFNPTTTIRYTLKNEGHVSLLIYNIRGQLVRQLVNANKFAGEYSAIWDGRDDFGQVVTTGTYLYSIDVNDFKYTRKMAFMK